MIVQKKVMPGKVKRIRNVRKGEGERNKEKACSQNESIVCYSNNRKSVLKGYILCSCEYL